MGDGAHRKQEKSQRSLLAPPVAAPISALQGRAGSLSPLLLGNSRFYLHGLRNQDWHRKGAKGTNNVPLYQLRGTNSTFIFIITLLIYEIFYQNMVKLSNK